MSLGSLLFLLSLVTFTRSECNGKDNLLIQALIPQNNPTFATDTVIPAVHLAVDTINNGSLLRDFCLNATIADTKVACQHNVPRLMFTHPFFLFCFWFSATRRKERGR